MDNKIPENKKMKCPKCGVMLVTSAGKKLPTIIKCPNGCTIFDKEMKVKNG